MKSVPWHLERWKQNKVVSSLLVNFKHYWHSPVKVTQFHFVSTILGAKELILSELVTCGNLRNSDLSNVHSNWHSAVKMIQPCFVSNFLGAE